MSLRSLLLSALFLLLGMPAQAQVTADGTAGTTVTPAGSTFTITNGTTTGTNLFHSFDQFSVPTGGSAVFDNATNISNIFSRVTGGSVSNIDGTIQAAGTANLYLINPNGILFGPDASLNIDGSFFATTADRILFDNNQFFSATDTSSPPLLTISAPAGVQFGANPNPITVQGPGHNLTLSTFITEFDPVQPGRNLGLQVNDGQAIALIGGDINFEGGNLTATQGRIELGSLAQAGTVTLGSDGLTPDYSAISSFDDVNLRQASSLDASGPGSGTIRLQGNNIPLLDTSIILNNTLGATNGGDTTLQAAGVVTLDGDGFNSGIYSQNFGSGTGGDINVVAQTMQVLDGADVSVDAVAAGQGGNIALTIAETLAVSGTFLDNASEIGAFAAGTGRGGDITVTAQDLTLQDFGFIRAGSLETADDGGNLTLTVAETLRVEAISSIGTTTFGNGKAGDINISAKNAQLVNLGFIESGTGLFDPTTTGTGGNITLTVTETLALDGADSNINSDTYSAAAGGNITLTAGNVQLTNGGYMSSGAAASGNAGRINLTVADTLLVEGAGIDPFFGFLESTSSIRSEAGIDTFSDTPVPTATGSGGIIDVTAGTIQVNDSGFISGTTAGQGNAGIVSLTATERIAIDAASISSSVESTATGNGGILSLQAPQISLTNQATVDTSTEASVYTQVRYITKSLVI